MQTWHEDTHYGLLHSRSTKTILYTLLCFSLAGLIAGFAFGGFTGRFSGKAAGSSVPTVSHHIAQPAAKALPADVSLGNPVIKAGDFTSSEKADGTTTYTFSPQIVTKDSQTPITATDVACRFWLTDDVNATSAALGANNYAIPRTLADFSGPFPQELVGVLTFTSPSQQVQPCNTNGKTTWTYKLSPSVPHGTYYLAVLADWHGVHYSWYMVGVQVS